MRIGSLLLLTSLLCGAAFAQIPTPIRSVSSLPATCIGGSAFTSSDVVLLISSGTGNFYQCTSTNTWTRVMTGGANAQTINYQPTIGDSGKIISMNGSSLTLTLPNPPPNPAWFIYVENVAGTALTVSRNGLLIDGASSNLSLTQNQGAIITTDGTNYFTSRGISGGAVPFSSINSGTNTTAAMVVSTAASLDPTTGGSGQIAATSNWLVQGLPDPVNTANASGGSLTANHQIVAQYTLVTAAGETTGSRTVTTTTQAGCGSSCSNTITAPTANCGALPCGGFTGYTAYSCDNSASPGCSPLKQAASNNCVNITTNCVIQVVGAGAVVPTISTAWPQPTNTQATVGPLGQFPQWFVQDQTGNYQTWLGVDPTVDNTNGPPSPGGTPTFYLRTWWNDTKTSPPSFKNSFVGIMHDFTNTLTEVQSNNQNRALAVFALNPVGFNSTTQYGVEGIQAEVDYRCVAPCVGPNGSPDGEATTASLQFADLATAHWSSNGESGVVRATYSNQGSNNGNLMNVFNGVWTAGKTAYTNGDFANLASLKCNNGLGNVTGVECDIIKAGISGGANTFANGQVIIKTLPINGTLAAPSSLDGIVRNDSLHNLNSYLNGPVELAALNSSDIGTIPMRGSWQMTGSLNMAQVAAPAFAGVPTCSGGATTYGYVAVGIDSNGGAVSSSTLNTASTCVNPLTGGNPATFAGLTIPARNTGGTPTEVTRIDVYRTSGPMSTGKIGTITCTNGVAAQGCTNFVDNGIAADGTAVPTVNTTGGIVTVANAVSHLLGNLVQVGSSGFTTANNANLQTITGLVFNLPPPAANYSFHCALAYSQGTATAAVAFGIQAATVNPTNIFATGTQQITVGPPETSVDGVLATLATTTATNIVTGTPGATGTNYRVYLDGTIEEPANNDAGQVLNIMVSTANGADAVTVLRGSFCTLQ